MPAELAGKWNMITERGNAFGYEIQSDGKYVYVAVMIDGNLSYTLQEGGRAQVAGQSITFTPQIDTLKRADSPDPSATGTTSSPQRPPRTFTWTATETTLRLTADGSTSTFDRG